ncbi:uncharacterized protein LOC127081085 [Lathyrus oleraceus]|uniref:uncharacterized protein LOC127081085 n=1 Tax=Pisum sativum TaxID=3888 RepID=UPI0021D38EF0|nr:uncharacterized protein LOC127081085 [Pisum sativum]
MGNVGLRLEEGVREGRLKKGSSSDGSKKYGNDLPKKKEHDANAISQERRRILSRNNQCHQHVASIIQDSIGCFERASVVYKPDQHYAFHQGAPGHDIENCFTMKDEVRRLMQSGILPFEDSNPNVQANSLPKHSNTTVNMVEGCPGKYRVFDVNLIRRSLVEMHTTLCELRYYEHDHASCQVCSRDPRGYVVMKIDLQEMLDQNLIQVTRDKNEDEHEVNIIVPYFNPPESVVIAYDGQKTVVSPLIIHLASPTPYKFDKVVPYKYNATMVEEDKEVPIPAFPFVVNITDASGVARSGRIFATATPKRTEDVVIEKSILEKSFVVQADQASIVNQNADQDEVLKLIKKSDFNMVDQLWHTPSNIFVLSLLMSLEAHREALQKVLEQTYMDHDVTIDQFDGIVANITASHNLSFSDEELPEPGRNHNLALHISMNSQEDTLSNMLVDTGPFFNVLPKSMLSKLAYQGAPMRYNGVVVKAFDGSRKTIIVVVDLPVKIEDEGTSFQALSVDNVAIKESGESMSSLRDA